MGIILMVVSLFVTYPMVRDEAKKTNEYVAVDVSLQQKDIRAGNSFSFAISFKLKTGIHITTDPPFQILLDSTQQFFSLGKLNFTRGSRGYLDAQKALHQRVTVAKSTPPGPHLLKGTFIYYYCSDEEGWCSKFRQPLELKLTVTK